MKLKKAIILGLSLSLLSQVTLPALVQAKPDKPTSQSQSKQNNKQNPVKTSLYDAVNQDYLKGKTIADDNFMAGVSTDVDQQNKKILHEDLVKLAKGTIKTSTPEEETMVKYYQQARDFDRRNQDGSQPAKPYLEKINQLKSFDDFKKDLPQWIDSGIDLPFAITSGASLQDPTTNQLRLIAPQTILPDTGLYQDQAKDSQGQQILKTYQDQAQKILIKMGYTKKEAKKLVNQALAYDQKIASHLTPSDQRRSLKDQLKEADPKALAKTTSTLDLIKTAEGMLDTKVDAANVTDSQYFADFNQLVNPDNFQEMKAWMLVTFAVKAAPYLDDDLRTMAQEISNAKTGQVDIPDQNEAAYQLIDQHFYEVLGVYFGKNYFGDQAKADVEAMTKEMIQIYKQRLEKIDWLTPETRQAAIDKLDHIKLLIGYPETYQDRTKKLKVDPNKSLLENTLTMAQDEAAHDLRQYGKAAESGYWSMPAYETNAYYSPSENLICMPAGILQAPYYSQDQSDSQNMGAIGATIAHEISHAFDTTGADFDSQGALRQWWQEADYQKFKERTKKIQAQFDKLQTEHGQVDSKLTLDENIADNAGLSVALEALKQKEDYDLKAFFTAYAKSWATIYRPEMASMMLTSDPHAPEKYRTDIPASNLDEFYQTFDIKPEDPIFRKPNDRFVFWQ
ncbi:hypothetical protein AWM75_00645 [Aerococcus urinaehominis]|uniref:Uncharacterized protein n=1 Tax=Aerococcus urinaehominis TaxID=128944 RepID=A0A109RGD4_9LACT|nr:M13 family metallopeptidase [Aerococcus urinaehominis]AMB98589.1 hypothetical protein AWM75_00645 [Aerococcus urinaehominis]SDL76697.1 putative endopeptidase [Aerococcus urinaehominis]